MRCQQSKYWAENIVSIHMNIYFAVEKRRLSELKFIDRNMLSVEWRRQLQYIYIYNKTYPYVYCSRLC